MVVGGPSHGVGIAGEYIQGGGHSLLSAIAGMAFDNELKFTVGTADLLQVTVQAFDELPFISFSLAGFASFGAEGYWKAVERFHVFLPKFSLADGSMYYWLMPDLEDSSFGHVSEMTASGGFVTVALRSLRIYSGNTVQGQNVVQGLVVAGPAVWANADKIDSALHPIWRKALLQIVLALEWNDGTSIADQREIQKNLIEVEIPILKKPVRTAART
ncbi:uncharacterized protein TRUGW13939_08571 [Talaromyces rugulosus]|uniref:FAD linked oxidase N-terminal domain-containing protein n=1 Tax=Talaromyces rugulosus TaxID=121627 RepID=A0A7H8R9M7_TALRU|nr:uncharacterized protein TRUGW13939_08571 [Talaromyces rugulosus]QKX61423.1 hypothetical protein TRUGW13939_08571 [Talaromyces rugulosus]